jgi:outer membrane biosynthesis protein TonB
MFKKIAIAATAAVTLVAGYFGISSLGNVQQKIDTAQSIGEKVDSAVKIGSSLATLSGLIVSEEPKLQPKKEEPKLQPKKEEPKLQPKKEEPKLQPKKEEPKPQSDKEKTKKEDKSRIKELREERRDLIEKLRESEGKKRQQILKAIGEIDKKIERNQ